LLSSGGAGDSYPTAPSGVPMQAVAVKEFGAVPELLELPVPTPGAGEVRVRMEGAGINPFDWKIADGVLKSSRPHIFPLVLGVDGAGTIDALGPGVVRFRVGDRIFGQFLHDPVGTGTYAERALVPESKAVGRIPSSISSWEASAIPTAGMTALDALDTLGLSSGQTLLVVGASGGVGSFTVPLAAEAGLRVIAVARPGSHERLRSIGATEAIDPSKPAAQAALRAAHPAGVDGLLDLASDGPTFARWAATVRPGGTAATTVHAAGPVDGVRTVNIDLMPRAELLERVGAMVAGGRIRVPLERVISLSEAPAVVAEGRKGRLTGKTVIRLDPRGERAPSA
jgi:NADPH:quinone reductase-like Zn-dependent oxidoreductase